MASARARRVLSSSYCQAARLATALSWRRRNTPTTTASGGRAAWAGAVPTVRRWRSWASAAVIWPRFDSAMKSRARGGSESGPGSGIRLLSGEESPGEEIGPSDPESGATEAGSSMRETASRRILGGITGKNKERSRVVSRTTSGPTRCR